MKQEFEKLTTFMENHFDSIENSLTASERASTEALEFVEKTLGSMEKMVKNANDAGQSISAETTKLLNVLAMLIGINRKPMKRQRRECVRDQRNNSRLGRGSPERELELDFR